jgi:hypothetical protein
MRRRGTLPTFLIIGAMKSGTTSLFRHISAHPEVFGAPGKELHFFDEHFTRGAAWYAEQFDHSGSEVVAGEATPNYMYDPIAVGRIASLIPDAKLIAILRQPVDRAYSHYLHNRERGRETLSFEDAIAAESVRLEQQSHVDGTPLLYEYLDRGRYARQLDLVAQHFPPHSLLVLLTDDLKNEPQRTYQQVCAHLGVSSTYVPAQLAQPLNRYVHFRSTRVRSVALRVKGPVGHVLARLNAQKTSPPTLDPALRRELTEQFETELVALEQRLARDLSHWRTAS